MPTMSWNAGVTVKRSVYAYGMDFGSPKIDGIQVWLNKELVGHLMVEMPESRREVRLDLEGGMMTFPLTKRSVMIDSFWAASDPAYLAKETIKYSIPNNATQLQEPMRDAIRYQWHYIGIGKPEHLAQLFDHDKFEPV